LWPQFDFSQESGALGFCLKRFEGVMMGFFSDLAGASKQRDRLFELKQSLVASDAWKSLHNSPLFGSGIRLGFAEVDCRRCGKTDSALLLDQSIWDWQTHKVSYSSCLVRGQGVWVAEFQGPQAAKSKALWLAAEYTSFDESTGESWVYQGAEPIRRFEGTSSLEEWILGDFISKGFSLKRKLEKVIIRSDNSERKLRLREYIELEKNWLPPSDSIN
jgi:hypothetical protein